MIYVQICGGDTVDLLNPDLTDITIAQIAKSLSHINRFTGHAGSYSVAQHSVHVAHIVRDRGYATYVQRGALLHDAHEAIIGDMGTPVKWALQVLGGGDALDILDDRHKLAIERRFRVHLDHPAVKQADRDVLCLEADQRLGGRIGEGWPEPADDLDFTIPHWTSAEASAAFLRMAQILGVS